LRGGAATFAELLLEISGAAFWCLELVCFGFETRFDDGASGGVVDAKDEEDEDEFEFTATGRVSAFEPGILLAMK